VCTGRGVGAVGPEYTGNGVGPSGPEETGQTAMPEYAEGNRNAGPNRVHGSGVGTTGPN